MQPLEEERDQELEPAVPDRAVVLEMPSLEPERPAPLLRRALLHAVLAVMATPLPGGLFLAARLISARRGLLAAAVLGAAFAAAGLGLAIALLAPVTLTVAAGLIVAVWTAAGLAAAVFEQRNGLAPLVPWAAEPRAGLQALTWGATLLVAAIPVAFSLAVFSTRWGTEIFAKPSAPRQVLFMALVALLPAGMLVGLCRSVLRRPHRLAPPVLFGAALFLLLLSVGCAQILWEWLARGLSRTEGIATESLVVPGTVVYSSYGILLWLALALYLSESRRSLELVQRWAVATALAFLFLWSRDLALGSGPVSWRNRWAETAAAEGRHADAARHWNWATARAPRLAETAGMVEKGAREALLAGDPVLARRLLLRIDAGLAREHGQEVEAAKARALLATRLDLGRVLAVRVPAVSKEDYLGAGWSALLSAVRALRPELGEAEIKQRLQDLSDSPTATSLPALSPILELKTVADLFDGRAVAFPYREKDRLLAAGFPVLVRPPAWDRWLLVHWSAPGADAVLALDYGLWAAAEETEDMDREEVAQLLVGNEGPESQAARALARVSALHADSRLAVLLARDGGRAFALIPRDPRKVPASLASLPDLPAGLLTLELARRELGRGAFRRGLGLASQIPPGPAREELFAWTWLSGTGRGALPPEAAPVAEAAALRLTAGSLGQASPWLVERLETLTLEGDPASCGLRERVVREALVLEPELGWRLEELAGRAADTGRGAEAASLALRFAAASGWESAQVARALEILAVMPRAGDDPAVRKAVETLLDRLDLVVPRPVESGFLPRRAMPGYCAGRAALARDPEDAVDWWRRAVELSPKGAPYRWRLADALERAGRKREAAQARSWAAAVDGVRACAGSAS